MTISFHEPLLIHSINWIMLHFAVLPQLRSFMPLSIHLSAFPFFEHCVSPIFSSSGAPSSLLPVLLLLYSIITLFISCYVSSSLKLLIYNLQRLAAPSFIPRFYPPPFCSSAVMSLCSFVSRSISHPSLYVSVSPFIHQFIPWSLRFYVSSSLRFIAQIMLSS